MQTLKGVSEKSVFLNLSLHYLICMIKRLPVVSNHTRGYTCWTSASRQKWKDKLQPTRTNKYSFFNRITNSWNSLPDNICVAPNLSTLKIRRKKYLT